MSPMFGSPKSRDVFIPCIPVSVCATGNIGLARIAKY